MGKLADRVAAASAAMVDAIHSKADYLTAETVNAPLQMKEFIEMGVASIGTDYPDLLRSTS